jgi:putative phosphoesterase
MRRMLIGLISDTHGLMRPEALKALARVELILHAGDVGGRGVLEALRTIAPVQAVIGNVDDVDDPDLQQQLDLTLESTSVHVSHGHELGSPTPEKLLVRYTGDVLIYGHTHRALIHRVGGRLVVNPGAAGPRRFDVKPSVGLLTISDANVQVEIVEL